MNELEFADILSMSEQPKRISSHEVRVSQTLVHISLSDLRWLSYTAKYVNTFFSLSLNIFIRTADTGSCFHIKLANHTLTGKKYWSKNIIFSWRKLILKFWVWKKSGNFHFLQQRFGISLLNRPPVGLVRKFQNAVIKSEKFSKIFRLKISKLIFVMKK